MSLEFLVQEMHVILVTCGARRERGIAMVIVLWVVMLLTVIVCSFVYNARTHIQATGNLTTRAQARALADAGVHRAVYELHKPVTDGERWKPDGRVYEMNLADGKVSVTILDETALIDLNAAPEALLQNLLYSVGVEEGQAQTLVAAIQDWRDVDDLVRPGGAEVDQYLAAGLKQGPPNRDYLRVDELKGVLGMTPELYDKVSAALTVYTMSPGINSALSPRQVLMAIPNVIPADVDAYLTQRQEQLTAGQAPTPFPPAAPYAGGGGNMVYTVRSEAVLADGTAFVREAVARLANGNPKHPFGFLDWREGRP
jgi:general secretion pathway protein K